MNFLLTLAKFFKTAVLYRTIHRRRSAKKGVSKNFADFTGKHLCDVVWVKFWRGWRGWRWFKNFWSGSKK